MSAQKTASSLYGATTRNGRPAQTRRHSQEGTPSAYTRGSLGIGFRAFVRGSHRSEGSVMMLPHPTSVLVSCMPLCYRPREYLLRGGRQSGEFVRPGAIRVIEYEIVAKRTATSMGLATSALAKSLGASSDVALLRCVNGKGDKLTAYGDADDLRALVDSGDASDPDGMCLPNREFPVLREGWL